MFDVPSEIEKLVSNKDILNWMRANKTADLAHMSFDRSKALNKTKRHCRTTNRRLLKKHGQLYRLRVT
jgi:hypothetical protein